MKTKEINIRDPFILPYEGKYYLYGTRSKTCWELAEGFDCYVSDDLENWEGPKEIFHRPEGFFADRSYWAPECIEYKGTFYLITTFGSGDIKKGIYILKSESPTGPFTPYSERLTPKDWVCIDGTIYFENGIPILIFSYSFESNPDGEMYMLPLSEDLKTSAGEPSKLFAAAEASWARPVPFAKEEFGIDGDVYFTDGPCVFYEPDGKLYMTWSSWSNCGYAVGIAVSESGSVKGPWKQKDQPIWPENGGHGMMFTDYEKRQWFVLHYPNERLSEHPMLIPWNEKM